MDCVLAKDLADCDLDELDELEDEEEEKILLQMRFDGRHILIHILITIYQYLHITISPLV